MNSKGECPFRIKVSKANQRKFIPLDIIGEVELWDNKQDIFVIIANARSVENKERNRRSAENNALIERMKVRAREIESDFERAGIDYTLNQFVDRFTNRGTKSNVSEYWTNHIDMLRLTGHTGNANCYANTIHILRLFDKGFDTRAFQEIDFQFVKKFDVWLQKRGCKGNTRKYYHKALRSMLNKAIQDGKAAAGTYPYGKGGFEVASLEEETAKRYLTTDVMAKVKATKMDNHTLEVTRRIFLAMYHCYGISWVDAAMLTTRNIVNLNSGMHIVYKRQKTQHARRVKPISIKISPELQSHFDWFAANTKRVGAYLFPIVSRDYTGEQLYTHIRSRFVTNNKHLKELAKALGMEGVPLTSYVSRHTMAMTLQSNDVPREIISQVLGHGDIKVTATYLDSFENEKIAEATKVL